MIGIKSLLTEKSFTLKVHPGWRGLAAVAVGGAAPTIHLALKCKLRRSSGCNGPYFIHEVMITPSLSSEYLKRSERRRFDLM